MTQPSGASDPRRIVSPPTGLIGRSMGTTTSCPIVSCVAAAISAIERPSTVRASPWRRSRFSSSRITRPTPPASYMSVAVKRPPGCMSATIGVRSAISPNSSISSGIPNSWAMARRWRTALVEPPVAATEAMAFSMAGLVTIADGRTSCRTRVITSSPHVRAAASFEGSSAGIPFRPPGEMPRNSSTVLIVLAVNCPPQAPGPGQAAFSTS